MNNEISLQQAIDMTARFRDEQGAGSKIDIPRCETFDRAIFDKILSQTGCVKMRIYSGLTPENGFRAIIVGVNEKDEDMLPDSPATLSDDGGGGSIGEDGITCPPFCPPPSYLNP